MPIFEYKCQVCGHQFERLVLHPGLGADSHRCPECSKTADRIISQSTFRLYGGGWDKGNRRAKKEE